MLTEEEFEAEMGRFKRPMGAPVRAKKRVQYYAEEEEEEQREEDEDDDRGMSLRAPAPRPSFRTPAPAKRKPTRIIEEDDDEVVPSATTRRSDWVDTAKSPSGPVPFRLQEAAQLIVDSPRVRLSQATLGELNLKILQRPCETCVVDPPVTLCASVDTGTIPIRCKEVVPISVHMMALAVGATFSVQITAKARTSEEPWAEAVMVRVCRNTQLPESTTPLNAMEAVQKALARLGNAVPEDLDDQVQRYMQSIGKCEPQIACDPEWMEPHIEKLREICHGKGEADPEAGGIKAKMAKLRQASAPADE